MKKLILAAYIFFFTGGCIAQQRENTVVAELDFNKPTDLSRYMGTNRTPRFDTVRATLLVTRDRMRMAFSYEGYAVFRDVPGKWVMNGDTLAPVKDTIYLDDRKRLIKPPITVWGMKEKEGKP